MKNRSKQFRDPPCDRPGAGGDDQMCFQPSPVRTGSGGNGLILLRAAPCHNTVTALGQRLRQQVFQLSDFISPQANAAQVLPLEEKPFAAAQQLTHTG